MATSTSFLHLFKNEPWKPTLWSDLRRILRTNGRKRAKPETVVDNKTSRVEISVAEASSESITHEVGLSHRVLQVLHGGKYMLCESSPMPELKGDDEIIIRNYAAGLNPIDWKSVDYNFCLPEFPWVTGREMAGVVHKVGSRVMQFRPGDRVWTSTYYKDIRAGCFQDFVTVPEHTVTLIPENLSYEEAACLGVAALTAAMTLWKWLQIPLCGTPSESPSECILIWGGSTITGQFAVQIAALSGLEVIAVTSAATSSLVKSLGATHVITRDGKSNQEIVDAIRAVGLDRVTRGLDLVGGTTVVHGLQTLSREKPCLFAPLAMMKSQEVPENVTIVNVEMKQFVLDNTASFYAKDLNDLISSGRLRLPELEILSGGLREVEQGLRRLRKGNMGGKKLIVSLQDILHD